MNKKGFTLIEVTIAIALFALAVVVLSQSFLGGIFSLDSFKFDDSEDQDLYYIYSKIIALENPSDIEKGGRIRTVNKGMAKWNANVDSTNVLELYKVTIYVSLEDKNYSEVLYTYKPNWAERGERSEFLRGKKQERSHEKS